MRIFVLLLLLHELLPYVSSRCADHSFIGCMLRLKTQRVPIEKNIMSLIFNIGTEARLLHTCKVYSTTLPCFQEKIRECGDEKQKRVLNEVSKTIMFLCSPFSMQRQRAVIEHQKCISSVLSMPASTGCQLEEHKYGRQVMECKRECSSRGSDFICMMRTWISEQNTCTLKDIEQKCGEPAASLFQELQTTVFEPSYPVVCNYGNETAITPAPKISPLKEKKVKTQHRKQQKSKTEVEDLPLILTSPSTLSTADNIYIAPPDSSKNNYYQTPNKPTNVVAYPTQEEAQERNSIWQKSGHGQKVQYNKEVWRHKSTSGEFVFTTQHPLFTTTEYGATPKRHKVIDILKSLIPPNLPSQLTALLENSYDKGTFEETQTYNTPSMLSTDVQMAATQQVYQTEPTTTASKTTMIPPKQEIPQISYRPVKTVATTTKYVFYPTQPTLKWKPWYLGGT